MLSRSDKSSSQSKWAQRVACTDLRSATGGSARGGLLRAEIPAQERCGMRDRDVDVGKRVPPAAAFPEPAGERRGGMR